MGKLNFKGIHTRTRSHNMWHAMHFKGICISECTETYHIPITNNPNQLTVFHSGVKEVYQSSYFNISTIHSKQNTRIQQFHKKMDISNTDAYEWELDRMFGIWISTTWEINEWIQVARTHRSTVILNKLDKVSFHCDDFLHWAYRLDQSLLATFMLALEIEFERHYTSTMKAMKPVMTMIYHSHYTNLPASMQYPQWLKLPLTLWVTRDLQYLSSHLPQKEGQQNPHFIEWYADI